MYNKLMLRFLKSATKQDVIDSCDIYRRDVSIAINITIDD